MSLHLANLLRGFLVSLRGVVLMPLLRRRLDGCSSRGLLRLRLPCSDVAPPRVPPASERVAPCWGFLVAAPFNPARPQATLFLFRLCCASVAAPFCYRCIGIGLMPALAVKSVWPALGSFPVAFFATISLRLLYAALCSLWCGTSRPRRERFSLHVKAGKPSRV